MLITPGSIGSTGVGGFGFTGLDGTSLQLVNRVAPSANVAACPNATGIKPNGSLLYSWESVPQIPHPSTFTRISPSPTSGMGNSFTSYFSNAVSMATLAVFGICPCVPDAAAAPAVMPRSIMLSSTCFTTWETKSLPV